VRRPTESRDCDFSVFRTCHPPACKRRFADRSHFRVAQTTLALRSLDPLDEDMGGTTNGAAEVAKMDFPAKMEAFRRSDAERDAMVTELLSSYEELKTKYLEKCDDHSNEVESRRHW
jgi:hypothetical protein